MHISEGVLSTPVLITGAIMTATGVAAGLKTMDNEDIPKTAIVASALFTASLIHVPIGSISAHLILNGLPGFYWGGAFFRSFLLLYFYRVSMNL